MSGVFGGKNNPKIISISMESKIKNRITKKKNVPEFGCSLLFGRADGAPSRASTSNA